MKMDRVDKIISMISDVVVTAYNCGEPLFTNHTTSLSAEKNEVLKKVEENISNPLSFKGFVKRMQTYNIKYWYAHRHAALQLARGGWENVGDYVVRCCFCEAEEDLRALVSTQEEALLELLSKQHASFCRWRTASSPEFFACAPHVQSSQGLRNTVTATAGRLLALGPELPKVPDVVLRAMKLGNETLELLVCGLLKDVPVSDVSVSAVVLTLCGWCLSSTTGILCCCYCDRRIALRHWISVQKFEEQRHLMLSENNVKLFSASFMQRGFVDDAQDKEEGSQSPLSELSHVDTDWDGEEEEEPEEDEDGDEEMEADEYEVYDQEAEQDDFITVDNEIYGNELNSKLKNSQNNHIQENKYEVFQNNDQDVEMEEDYDELEAQELVESNFNEEDDVDDYTDDEMPPNEDGPYDNTQEVETSDESVISDNEEDLQEEKTVNLKIPHKQVQYHNNENEQNEEYHNAVENQYSNCANEIGSSDDDDVLVENDVRLEVEEEEIEHEKGEEIGDEDEENDEDDCDDEDDDEDDDEEDDDDDDDDDEDEDEEDYDEMPEDGRSQGNDSDKVIELSDSDEEIEPQSKEKVQTLPSPTSVMMVETEVIVTEVASDENKQNSCEKLSDKPDTKIEGVGLSGDSKNQDPKSVNSVKENILKINVDKVESQDGVTMSEKQEKTTLKRKRDNENDIGLELDVKRKPISFDECKKESPIDENGTVVVAGDLEDDKSSMQVGKIPLDEGADKNSEMCQDDDNLITSEACKSRVVEERVTREDTHCEAGELNGLKNKCEEEISGSTGTAGVGVMEVSNSEQTEIKSTKQEDLSLIATRGGGGETAVITKTECVLTTAVPASEIGSSAAVAKSEAVCPSDSEHVTQKQTVPAVKSAENGSGNMPVLLPEVRSESSGTGTPQPVPDSEDAAVNMPVLVREVKQERGKVVGVALEAPAAPSVAQGDCAAAGEGSENKVTESPASVEASKEDGTPGETGHSVDATRCVVKKSPHAGEDKGNAAAIVEPGAEPAVRASSSKSENVSEGVSCEPKTAEDVCPEKAEAEESVGTEGKCSSDLNEAAGQDGEAMDVSEASEQVAGRGTKRSRGSESESERSQPAAKRLQPDAEVRKPQSLLDPIAEHRFWCLWAPVRTAASYQRKCGWEVVFQDIMDKIVQQRQEQDHADITRKVRRLQEQIFPL